MKYRTSIVPLVTALALAAPMFAQLQAPDGAILIDQQHALIGGIGNGDTNGFPVTITQSGLYRLTSNLTVPNSNTNAIEVKADNVVIDLNGFSILGPTVCPIGSVTTSNNGETAVTSCSPTGTGIGIRAGDPYTISSTGPVANGQVGVRVINGTVAGMGDAGIVLGPAGRIENVTVRSNGGHGILTGRGSIVRNDIAMGNGGIGLFIGNASLIQGNVSTLNKSIGMEVGSGLTTDNVALRNGGPFGTVQFGEAPPPVFATNASAP